MSGWGKREGHSDSRKSWYAKQVDWQTQGWDHWDWDPNASTWSKRVFRK